MLLRLITELIYVHMFIITEIDKNCDKILELNVIISALERLE